MGPGATRNTASAATEAVLLSILKAASQSDKLYITRFGTFCINKRQALTFRPSKGLMD